MPVPITKKKYLELFNEKRDEALKTALDTRKFEIEMYWKRATYFWAFIATTVAGYFALISSDNIDSYKGFTILISSVGFFFSLGWYFVNRGSKFWQENWEKHVSLLEDDIQGPLFGTIKIPKDKFKNLNGHYPFSVSKVNQILSLIVVAFWTITFIFSILYSFDCLYYIGKLEWHLVMIISVILIVIIILLAIYFKNKSHSFLKGPDYINATKKDGDIFYLNKDIEMNNNITMGNDEFILYIRKWHPNCKTSTPQLGKSIWIWLRGRGAVKLKEQPQHTYWVKAEKVEIEMLPEHATQFEFKRSLLPKLYTYLDELGEK